MTPRTFHWLLRAGLVVSTLTAVGLSSRFHVYSGLSADAAGTPLPKPYQQVRVVADDDASRAMVDETRTDLLAVYQVLSADYAATSNTPYAVHLVDDEAGCRRVLARLGQSQAAIECFFEDNLPGTMTKNPAAATSIVCHWVGRDLSGTLAYDAAISSLRPAQAGEPPDGPYPYWFARGFAQHVAARFSRQDDAYLDWAIHDARKGIAPSLESISSRDSVVISDDGLPSANVDTRGEAVVDYLASTYGEKALRRLVNPSGFGNSSSFNAELQGLTKMSPDDLDRAVSAWLRTDPATVNPVALPSLVPTLTP